MDQASPRARAATTSESRTLRATQAISGRDGDTATQAMRVSVQTAIGKTKTTETEPSITPAMALAAATATGPVSTAHQATAARRCERAIGSGSSANGPFSPTWLLNGTVDVASAAPASAGERSMARSVQLMRRQSVKETAGDVGPSPLQISSWTWITGGMPRHERSCACFVSSIARCPLVSARRRSGGRRSAAVQRFGQHRSHG